MSRAGGCSHCLPPGFSPFVSVELHTNPRGRHSPLPKHPRQRCCRGCFLPFPPVGRRQSQCLAVLCHVRRATGMPSAWRRSINSWSLWGHRESSSATSWAMRAWTPWGESPSPTARPKNQPRGKTPWRHCRALCPSVRLTVEGCRSKVSASSRPSKGPGTEVLPRKKSSWAATKAVRHRVRVSCRRRTHCSTHRAC